MANEPSRINPVSILMFLGLVAAGYGVYQLGPHYVTEWKLKTVLKEGCSELYQASKRSGPRFEYIQPIEQKIHARMRELGIMDPEAVVAFDTSNPQSIVAWAAYAVVIEHPFIHRETVLQFRPQVEIDSRTVDWDKR